MNAAGQIGQHQAAEAGVKGRNRAKLKNFEAQNRQYLTDVMFDNAEWKNEVQVQDIEQDQIYQSMVNQWSEQDQQLDKMFAQADQKIEKAIVEMYENEYAGTGTGRTAARLANKGAKKLGQYKSEVLHSKMMAQEEVWMRKDTIHTEAGNKSLAAFEKIRFAPIHGPTPMAPELEAAPSKAGLILGLAQTALGTAAQAGVFKAPDIGQGLGDADAFKLASEGNLPDLGITGGYQGGGFTPPAGMFDAGGTAQWQTGPGGFSGTGAHTDFNIFRGKM